jgi:hypothetical protein
VETQIPLNRKPSRTRSSRSSGPVSCTTKSSTEPWRLPIQNSARSIHRIHSKQSKRSTEWCLGKAGLIGFSVFYLVDPLLPKRSRKPKKTARGLASETWARHDVKITLMASPERFPAQTLRWVNSTIVLGSITIPSLLSPGGWAHF